ncbi:MULTISPECIES: hypothetical protein [Sporosarcina]|uniref:Uncharacterized protein n=1 Tax=Sporosarcina contaminans TaxID=633403 RepID=A0ABW3TT10_9BACL
MLERNKEMIRMELQIGQLIRIVATMNERIKELEDLEKSRKVVSLHRLRSPEKQFSSTFK